MGTNILGNGKITKEMEREINFIMIIQYTRVIGKRIYKQVKDKLNFLLGPNIKDNFRKI